MELPSQPASQPSSQPYLSLYLFVFLYVIYLSVSLSICLSLSLYIYMRQSKENCVCAHMFSTPAQASVNMAKPVLEYIALGVGDENMRRHVRNEGRDRRDLG
jgi:hypothetical protein